MLKSIIITRGDATIKYVFTFVFSPLTVALVSRFSDNRSSYACTYDMCAVYYVHCFVSIRLKQLKELSVHR